MGRGWEGKWLGGGGARGVSANVAETSMTMTIYYYPTYHLSVKPCFCIKITGGGGGGGLCYMSFFLFLFYKVSDHYKKKKKIKCL